jgi:hypothetical protein
MWFSDCVGSAIVGRKARSVFGLRENDDDDDGVWAAGGVEAGARAGVVGRLWRRKGEVKNVGRDADVGIWRVRGDIGVIDREGAMVVVVVVEMTLVRFE